MRANDLMLDWGDSSQLYFFSAGQAIPGGSVRAVELPRVPEAPSGLAAKQVWLSTDVEITWQDESDDETGFRVQYRTVPSPPFGWRTAAELAADATSYRFTDTTFDLRYHFRVAAFNDAGTSTWSNEDSVVVLRWVGPWAILVPVVILALVGWGRWALRSRRRG